jgi:hypothetical protein
MIAEIFEHRGNGPKCGHFISIGGSPIYDLYGTALDRGDLGLSVGGEMVSQHCPHFVMFISVVFLTLVRSCICSLAIDCVGYLRFKSAQVLCTSNARDADILPLIVVAIEKKTCLSDACDVLTITSVLPRAVTIEMSCLFDACAVVATTRCYFIYVIVSPSDHSSSSPTLLVGVTRAGIAG